MSHIHRQPRLVASRRRSARRRGTALILCLVLIPVSLTLYLTVLSRLDIAYAQTKRDAARMQARLLAESALAAYQTALEDAPAGTPPHLPLSGALEGIGAYRVVALEGNKPNAESGAAPSARGIRAIGAVEYLKGTDNSAKALCEIEAEVSPSDKAVSSGAAVPAGASIPSSATVPVARPSLKAYTICYRAEVLGR
ncbi:MAG: hypothetical protein NTX50_03570 [Candidatus Sumerlaeota bacterium]|nr:hypothetical protein [Candidatus Sumerlaeota bacterium]